MGSRGWIDLKRVRAYQLSTPGPYLPVLTITHQGQGYELTLEILPDPRRDVLQVRYKLKGDYRLVVILAPHLGQYGAGTTALVLQTALDSPAARGWRCVLGADPPLRQLSCGYVGQSDGWQDLNRHGALTYGFQSASNGTVAITGEGSAVEGGPGAGLLELRARRPHARSKFSGRWVRRLACRVPSGLGCLGCAAALTPAH